MSDSTRAERAFDESYERELGELNGTGKKNAKRAGEIHDEIELLRETVVEFLERKLPELDVSDWREDCVEAAFSAYIENNPQAIPPDHRSLPNFDLKSLLVLLEYNLAWLVFERDEIVTVRDIREAMRIRNAYEHRTRKLNYRNWRKDLDVLRVFRSKMLTDVQLENECFEASQLEEMERDSALYQEELDMIERRIEAMTNSIFDLGESVRAHSTNDAEQFEELERQRERDKSHDQAIGEQAEGILWLTKRDRIQKAAIATLSVLVAANTALIARVMWKLR